MNEKPHNTDREPAKKEIAASAIGAAGRGAKAYLSDWKNWLTHGLIGVCFLALAIWAPVELWIKLVVIACVVCFNVVRMRRKSRKDAAAKTSTEASAETD